MRHIGDRCYACLVMPGPDKPRRLKPVFSLQGNLLELLACDFCSGACVPAEELRGLTMSQLIEQMLAAPAFSNPAIRPGKCPSCQGELIEDRLERPMRPPAPGIPYAHFQYLFCNDCYKPVWLSSQLN